MTPDDRRATDRLDAGTRGADSPGLSGPHRDAAHVAAPASGPPDSEPSDEDVLDGRGRWNTRHANREPVTDPAAFLVDRARLLPTHGRALDLAGGTGRNALWLASRGLGVTLVDVSDEACRVAAAAALEVGVPLDVQRRDVAVSGAPPGPWELVLIHHFLARAVVARADELLAPGGVLLWCQPTVRNLERHERPGRRWLLAEGEAETLARTAPGIEVVEAREGWTAQARHEAHLVVRRPVATVSVR